MNIALAFVLSLAALAACSRPPSSIKAIAAVGQPFATYDCPMLVTERLAYMDRLAVSVKTQNTRAAGDALLVVGVGLIGLGVGKAVAGQDEETNIGTYRGAIVEIDTESQRKACVDPVFFTPEPKPKPIPNSEGPAPS